MASEIAQQENAHLENVKSSIVEDVHMTNGDHAPLDLNDATNNESAFAANSVNMKPGPVNVTNISSEVDSSPAGPTPIEDVTPSISTAAEIVPKLAPLSHPTPPPDEPLATPETHADTDMPTLGEDPVSEPEPSQDLSNDPATAVSSSESSLIRPREEDDESDEPIAKRSRVNELTHEDIPIRDAPSASSSVAEQAQTEEPVKTAPVDDASEVPASDPMDIEQANHAAAPSEPAVESKPIEPDVKPTSEIISDSTTTALTRPTYSRDSITSAQHKFLQEKMKNLKKTKNSVAFLNPVDPVALNIPSYLEIVKVPMDLSTMENKLKNGEYTSVQAFADDFDLIIDNTRKFNGAAHPVTLAGLSMEAYFRKMMESVPRTDQPAPQRAQTKKPSPKPPASRRESRSAVVATSPTATAGNATFALQPDGTPQIRRDSTINRPSRAIKPPQNREISYAKPKRKEAQLELKFCDHVLGQMRGPKYAHLNAVFQQPVDPVALNIPNYRQVIKHPMDLSTVSNKLKQGEYGKASEFKKDIDLMFQNCLNFNPPGNAVRDMGIQFQRVFEDMWRSREKWERGRKAETQRATSGSADEDSGDDEDEEDDEDEGAADDQTGTIKALQKQLIEIQNTLAGIKKAPSEKQKKGKPGAKSSKKAGNAAASKSKSASKPKGVVKKPKQVTYEEKQEISEAVGRMNNSQIEELTRIITTNCKRYADQEEMELEIDDLPNDVQVMLLQYVRSLFGNPKRVRAASPDDIAAVDDDDFEPDRKVRGGQEGKRKKHKPMGKKEQQDTINNIQARLRQFQNIGTSGSESPTNSNTAAHQGADSSDDESEESEEE